jgi:hypothetical protein
MKINIVDFGEEDDSKAFIQVQFRKGPPASLF